MSAPSTALRAGPSTVLRAGPSTALPMVALLRVQEAATKVATTCNRPNQAAVDALMDAVGEWMFRQEKEFTTKVTTEVVPTRCQVQEEG